MQPSAKIGKSATEIQSSAILNYGQQNVGSWQVGNGLTILSPGSRLRPWTWVNGMRVCIRLQNEDLVRPVEYHWALVQKREPDSGTPSTGVGALNSDWWRDNRPGQVDVFTDFDTGASPPTAAWSPFLSCGRIATSRYKVITHRKVLVAPEPGNAQVTDSHTYKGLGHIYHCEKYIKMKKKVLFNAQTDVAGRYPVYFVDWCTTPTESAYPSVLTAACRRYVELTTYYDAF